MQEIFEKAGKRNAEGVRSLIFKVEQLLIQEAKTGQNKLGKNIEETRKSKHGKEYFVDGKIAYLPAKGRAVFIGDTHGDSLATESIAKQVRFVENMEQGKKDMFLVFLGDYADRGNNSVRNLEMVLALKERYPHNVILMMGNHEEGGGFHPYELPADLKEHFGEKNGSYLHKRYTELFRQLPNMVVTANGIVAIHGGVPVPVERIRNLQDLKNNETAFRQMRWNDPNPYIEERTGSARGGGIYEFGQKPFEKFMEAIGGKLMVRSHEYPRNGYELFFNNKLVTIFSNGGKSRESNYAGRVQPKFMIASLTEPISEISSKHIVALNYS